MVQLKSILDLPDLILEKIGSKLKIDDFRHFRLTCHKFFIVSLSPTIMKKIIIDFRKVNHEDVDGMHKFLENIGYGRHGKFITSDAKYDDILPKSTTKLEEYFNFASKIRNVSCEMLLLENLPNFCPDVRELSLKDTKNVRQYHSIWKSSEGTYSLHEYAFKNTFRSTLAFSSLRDLQIQGVGSLSMSVLQKIVSGINTLRKFSISYGLITLDMNSLLKSQIINGSFEPSVELKNSSISEWSFGHIDTDGFKLILPDTACSVFKSFSKDILWNVHQPRNLKTLILSERKYKDFEQELPRKLEHLHLKLPHVETHTDRDAPFYFADSTLFYTKCNIANYTQLTLSRTLHPDIVKLILFNKGDTSCLVKLHLINSPVDSVRCGALETFRTHAHDWRDNDVIKILPFHRNLKTLVLENFFDITENLLQLMPTQLDGCVDGIELLKVINCCGFSKTNQKMYSDVKGAKFKVEVVEDFETCWGQLFQRRLKQKNDEI